VVSRLSPGGDQLGGVGAQPEIRPLGTAWQPPAQDGLRRNGLGRINRRGRCGLAGFHGKPPDGSGGGLAILLGVDAPEVDVAEGSFIQAPAVVLGVGGNQLQGFGLAAQEQTLGGDFARGRPSQTDRARRQLVRAIRWRRERRAEGRVGS
jgi:hypothetical protein